MAVLVPYPNPLATRGYRGLTLGIATRGYWTEEGEPPGPPANKAAVLILQKRIKRWDTRNRRI